MSRIDTALIDGDILVYRCGYAAEHTRYTLTTSEGEKFEFENKSSMNKFIKENELEEFEYESQFEVEPLDHTLSTVKHAIGNILGAVQAADYKIFLSSRGGNFRDKVATVMKYKGNRDDRKKPHWYEEIRTYLTKYYDAETADNLEADDLLAINQSTETVICSIDKDLLQVPGKHYNWVTDAKLLVSPETAEYNLNTQMLTGDRTDNIPGIKGVGPATAKKWLDECEPDKVYEMIYAKWDEHLTTDPEGKWWSSYDPEHQVIGYFPWNAGEHEMLEITLDAFLMELRRLLKVGDPTYGEV